MFVAELPKGSLENSIDCIKINCRIGSFRKNSHSIDSYKINMLILQLYKCRAGINKNILRKEES